MSTSLGNGGDGTLCLPRDVERRRGVMSGRGRDLAMGNKFGLEPAAWGNTVCAKTQRTFVLPCQPGTITLFY